MVLFKCAQYIHYEAVAHFQFKVRVDVKDQHIGQNKYVTIVVRNTNLFRILGYNNSDYEEYDLGCKTMEFGRSLPTFRRNVFQSSWSKTLLIAYLYYI